MTDEGCRVLNDVSDLGNRVAVSVQLLAVWAGRIGIGSRLNTASMLPTQR